MSGFWSKLEDEDYNIEQQVQSDDLDQAAKLTDVQDSEVSHASAELGRQAHVASHSSSQRGLRLENQETRETAQQHNTRPANSATGNPRAPDYYILQHPVDTEMCEKPLLFYHTVRSYREEHSPQ